MRGCSFYDQLLELYLDVEVKSNTYPDFVDELETNWVLNVGDIFEYRLPKLSDRERNDVPEVYISGLPNQVFPPFVSFNNATNTLVFRPDDLKYQGYTHNF